jgi:hypothetical protein
MKGISKLFMAVLALSVVLAACSGGGGGGGGGTATGTFVKTLAPGASTSSQTGPFNTNPYRRAMHIYRANDIKGSGYIQSISLRRAALLPAAVSCPNTSIRLGHTSKTEFDGVDNTFAGYVNEGRGSLVPVINNATVTIPAGANGDYYTVNFATPFYYNDVDNLVVDIERTTACTPSDVSNATEIALAYYAQLYSSSSPLTGTRYTWYQHMKFNFIGGNNTAISHDKTADTGNTSMVPGDTGHTQMLVFSTDINGSGRITGMAIKPMSTTIASVITGMTVRITHLPTSVTELTTNFANNFHGNTPVVVTQNLSYTIPAGQSSPVWIPFNNADFVYDGSSNLLIDLIATTTAAYSVAYTEVPGYRVLDSDSLTSSTGTLWQRAFEPVFRFAGGTMDVISGSTAGTFVFDSTASGRQFLLRAAELGTAGSISKLACRLAAPSLNLSYPNFTVTLAHTTQNVLVADDATNISGGVVVYNGTFTVPADLLEGDWVEIPFNSSFNYNGVDNLVVQTTTGAGSNVNSCRISDWDATWFADRLKTTGGGAPLDYRGNFRFWVNK